MKRKKNYDITHRVVRVLAGDYALLIEISQLAGISMAEALHRLIEHQAQLPLLDMAIKPAPAARVTGIATAAVHVTGAAVKVVSKSPNVQLRVNVAGKENGYGQ